MVNKRKLLLSQILCSRLGEADNKQVDKEMTDMLSNSYKDSKTVRDNDYEGHGFFYEWWLVKNPVSKYRFK